jgi:hypothetical protein
LFLLTFFLPEYKHMYKMAVRDITPSEGIDKLMSHLAGSFGPDPRHPMPEIQLLQVVHSEQGLPDEVQNEHGLPTDGTSGAALVENRSS